jgi:hypothetical protein
MTLLRSREYSGNVLITPPAPPAFCLVDRVAVYSA